MLRASYFVVSVDLNVKRQNVMKNANNTFYKLQNYQYHGVTCYSKKSYCQVIFVW